MNYDDIPEIEGFPKIPLGRANSLVDKKFNRLTILYRVEKTAKKGTFWLCRCECGNLTVVEGMHLKKGDTVSCGCYHRELSQEKARKIGKNNKKDLIGRRFGKLIVLNETNERSSEGGVIWNCICDCGGSKKVPAQDLVNNITKSCGCLQHQCNNKKDLLGQTFGFLTVAEETKNRDPGGSIMWKCFCSNCNSYIEVSSHYLQPGKISCGCIKSKGETLISDILQKNNIEFKREYTFSTCVFSDTKAKARFDFYLPNYNILIEYDGQQHFKYQDSGWDTKDKYEKTKIRDNYKNQWCKENNIPLIRIPYTDYDLLSWNYLQQKIKEVSI